MLPDPYISYEEAYHHRTDPRDVSATVLLTYDQDALADSTFGTTGYYQGTPPAAAWFRDGKETPVDLYNQTSAAESNSTFTGRTWYTSLGYATLAILMTILAHDELIAKGRSADTRTRRGRIQFTSRTCRQGKLTCERPAVSAKADC